MASEELEQFSAKQCGGTEYFVEGESYFRSVYEEVEALNGPHEVIIAGWKFEPELFYFLGEGRDESRMDRWMLRAAERGVQFYIQFWYGQMNILEKGFFKTMKVTSRAKNLLKLHPNIHVLIDSRRGVQMTMLWTTHIKAIVINGRIAYAGGFDMATWRWDSPQHLRPTPQRAGGEGSWIDVAVRISGLAAWDLRTVLVTRHTSYCSSKKNMVHRKMLKFKLNGYDSCDTPQIPSVALGQCEKDGSCSSQWGPTKCEKGKCFCQQDFAPLFSSELGTQACEALGPFGSPSTGLDSCRVLLTANPEGMDVKTNRPDILEAYLESIQQAEQFIIIDNQYFVGACSDAKDVSGGHGLTKNGPVNQVMMALLQKIKEKISKDEAFSVVFFLCGKTSDSHQPTIQTLFGDRECRGLVPSLIAYLRSRETPDAESAWRKYVSIAWAGNAVTRTYLHQTLGENLWQEVLASGSHAKELPPEGHASVYGIFIHSKVLIVDGIVAQVGSANVNDRSLRGDSSSDTELNVEVRGPSVEKLFNQILYQYTGNMHLPADANLANLINQIAYRNNDKMAAWVGMDFGEGLWEGTNERLFEDPGKSAEFVDMMSGDATLILPAWGERPNFEGVIFPWTAALWGDPYAEYWKSTLAKFLPRVTY